MSSSPLVLLNLLDIAKTINPTKEYHNSNDGDILLDIYTACISQIVNYGDMVDKQTHQQFYPPNNKVPSISIRDYLQRLIRYSPCSSECFIASLIYIDRLSKECQLLVNSYNIHRILITTLVIATKYLDDIFYNNEFYSQVGGINLREMNKLELDFLNLVKFNAVCDDDKFSEYSKCIQDTKSRFLSFRIQTQLIRMPGNITPPSSNSPRRNSSPYYPRRGSCDQGSFRSQQQTSSNDSIAA